MSNNDPTKWEHFESMSVLKFLQAALYYKDKQDDIRREQELAKQRR